MMIAKRHPLMKHALGAERGVVGTYAVAVMAVIGSLISAVLLIASVQGGTKDMRGSTIDPTFAAAAASPSGLTVHGADLSADQPFYDESAGVLIYTRRE